KPCRAGTKYTPPASGRLSSILTSFISSNIFISFAQLIDAPAVTTCPSKQNVSSPFKRQSASGKEFSVSIQSVPVLTSTITEVPYEAFPSPRSVAKCPYIAACLSSVNDAIGISTSNKSLSVTPYTSLEETNWARRSTGNWIVGAVSGIHSPLSGFHKNELTAFAGSVINDFPFVIFQINLLSTVPIKPSPLYI